MVGADAAVGPGPRPNLAMGAPRCVQWCKADPGAAHAQTRPAKGSRMRSHEVTHEVTQAAIGGMATGVPGLCPPFRLDRRQSRGKSPDDALGQVPSDSEPPARPCGVTAPQDSSTEHGDPKPASSSSKPNRGPDSKRRYHVGRDPVHPFGPLIQRPTHLPLRPSWPSHPPAGPRCRGLSLAIRLPPPPPAGRWPVWPGGGGGSVFRT